jgi:hypothetical protein
MGMPTQNDFVLLMFWTFVFWVAVLAGVTTDGPRPSSAGVWVGLGVLTAAFVAATAWVAVAGLRLPLRAVQADWDFDYGSTAPEPLPDGSTFRWTGSHAVSVAYYDQKFVRLTFWVSHPNVAESPVHVQIRDQHRTLVDTWLRDTSPHVLYIQIRGWAEPRGEGWHLGANRLMLETRVDRTWRPSDQGASDLRDLGLALSAAAVRVLPEGTNPLDSGGTPP